MRHSFFRFVKTVSTASYCLLVAFPIAVSAATLTLGWIENDPNAQSYRVFQRTDSEAYDYSNWIYSGSDISFTVDNLQDGVTYFFVVRAYSADADSSDSNEIEYNSYDEFENGGNPEAAPGNQAPLAPELSEPAAAAIVGLTTYSDQTACFISTPMRNIESQKSHSLVLMLLAAIGGIVGGVIERRSNSKR